MLSQNTCYDTFFILLHGKPHQRTKIEYRSKGINKNQKSRLGF